MRKRQVGYRSVLVPPVSIGGYDPNHKLFGKYVYARSTLDGYRVYYRGDREILRIRLDSIESDDWLVLPLLLEDAKERSLLDELGLPRIKEAVL